jgi:hypothetical protein
MNTALEKEAFSLPGGAFFSVDGNQRPFAHLGVFYRRSTGHYTNNVYQGNSLWVGLRYAGEESLDTYLVVNMRNLTACCPRPGQGR